MVFRDIKQEAKQALNNNRLMFLLAILVIVSITTGSSVIGIGFVIGPALYSGLYLLGKSLLENKEFDFEIVFTVFKKLNHVLKLFGVVVLTSIYIIVGLILFIIPGIIFAYRYSQSLYIMVENPEISVLDALDKSRDMMKGHKFEFFVFQLSFILHFILGIITFGLYFLYFIPYYQLSMYNYYYHLTGQDKQKNPNNDDLVEVEFN